MVVYTRITEEERTLIHRWIQEGEPQSEIARRLSRNPGSISREIGRNTGLRGYRPKQAHEKAKAQATRAGPRRFTDEVRTDAEARLKEGWTWTEKGTGQKRGQATFQYRLSLSGPL